MAKICGKSGRRSERIIVRTALRKTYTILNGLPNNLGSGKSGSLQAIRGTAWS